MIKFHADKNLGGQRLDRMIRKVFPDEGLGRLLSTIRKKKVRVNGKVAKAAQKVEAGDEICVYENLHEPVLSHKGTVTANKASGWVTKKKDSHTPKKLPWKEAFRIVEEYPDYLIVEKFSGIPSQPGSGQREGSSLVEALWSWSEETGHSSTMRPALAHRLDKETSGLVICALEAPKLRFFNDQIRRKALQKHYFALVYGDLQQSEGTIRLELERKDSARGAKMDVVQKKSKGLQSVTHYKTVASSGKYHLLEILLETGRMHQIRTHFAHIGAPLCGDGRYGNFELNRKLKKEFGLKRLFLHATRLQWSDPEGAHRVEIPLASDLQKAWESIQNQSDRD